MKGLYQHKQTVTTVTPTGPVTLVVEHHYEHSAPLSIAIRRAFYYAQNGGHPLTARQERAIRKAEKRDLYRTVLS